jgi:antitoxin VapB
MALHIRDERVDRLVRQLASERGVGLTEAVGLAVENELKSRSVIDRVRRIQDRIAALPKTGLKADKAFYDSLNDE